MRNPDERTRRLERAAAGGDPHAQHALWLEHVRAAGGIFPWLAQASPEEVYAAVPRGLLSEIAERFVLASATSPYPDPAAGMQPRRGWFPRHTTHNECPRGHELGGHPKGGRQTVFHYNSNSLEWWQVFAVLGEGDVGAGEPLVSADTGDRESTGPDWMSCGVCGASWPVGSIEWD
jgi:hypothetical protein